jgi:hypothetical protein
MSHVATMVLQDARLGGDGRTAHAVRGEYTDLGPVRVSSSTCRARSGCDSQYKLSYTAQET